MIDAPTLRRQAADCRAAAQRERPPSRYLLDLADYYEVRAGVLEGAPPIRSPRSARAARRRWLSPVAPATIP